MLNTCFCSCVNPNNASFTGKYEEHRDVDRSGDLLLKNGFETTENSFRVDIMKSSSVGNGCVRADHFRTGGVLALGGFAPI